MNVTNQSTIKSNPLSVQSLIKNFIKNASINQKASSVYTNISENVYTEGNGDTGSSNHFIPVACEHLLLDVKPTTDPIRVECPDGTILTSSKTALLNMPHLPIAARTCHIFDTITAPLLSIGKFCDHGMNAAFDDRSVTIRCNVTNKTVLSGTRDSRGMYMISLVGSAPVVSNSNCESANATLYSQFDDKKTVAQRVQHLSLILGNPSDSTLTAAAKKNFLKSFPGTTAEQIKNFPPDSIATAKGHLDQSRAGTWSTARTQQANRVYAKELDISTLFVEADSTGNYPVTSRKGNSKILILYCTNGNFIKSIPLGGDKTDDFIKGYDSGLRLLKKRFPKLKTILKIDNQVSADLKHFFITTHDTTIKLAPPNNHRTLKAERMIRTWKNHFIATRATWDPSFPHDLWDETCEQVDLTLNLLRPSNAPSGQSAWDFTCGTYNFMEHPIGPVGTKVLVYENPQQRRTFADHGIEGYYIRPAWDHYRCFVVYIPSTRDFRISDTLSWHCHDPYGLLSQLSPLESLTTALNTLNNTAQYSGVTDATVTSAIQSLTSLIQSTQIVPPGPTPTVTVPRVENLTVDTPSTATVNSPRVPVTRSRSPLLEVEPVQVVVEPPPRVALSTSDKLKCKKQKVPKRSRTLSSNNNHVITDTAPVPHNATKIISHKGSDSKPLNPLRFRVRWEGLSVKDDTFEPYANVNKCRALAIYIEAHPKLWYLLEPSLANLPRNKNKQKSPPLTRQRASEIAQAVMSAPAPTKHALYYMLSMTPTDDMIMEMEYAMAAGDMNDDGEALKYKRCITGPDKAQWITAAINEYHKLLKTHQTIRPIKYSNIPAHKKQFISYYNPQCKIKHKSTGKQYRIRGTYGGNKPSSYTGVTASYQASMSTVKLLLNKTVSNTQDKWMTMDVTDMYLNTKLPQDQWEYMVIDINEIPQEIIDTYDLRSYMSTTDTKAYFEVMGALYGMKQAGYLANKDIVEHLANNGYNSCPNTPCLFKHVTDNVEFTLITDDFGVRYGDRAAAEKLFSVMSSKYPMTIDWEGKKYAGFNILFDYDSPNRRVELSMQGYIAAFLKRFKHITTPSHNVLSPEFYESIQYGQKTPQLTKLEDTSPPLSPLMINTIQQIIGCLLYYVRGVDATMLLAVDHISREQLKGTEETLSKVKRLIEYAATFPDATIIYYPSDMVLIGNVDGSYNSEPGAKSRAALFSYLGRTNEPSFINGPLQCFTTLIPTIVTSAAETEYASLFMGGKELLPLRYNLDDMDCIQGPTKIITDNSAAESIATKTCKQRRSKSMDIRYHWIRDRVALKDFEIEWQPGSESIADYLTKVQPVAMVLKMRRFFVKNVEPTFKLTAYKSRLLQANHIARVC